MITDMRDKDLEREIGTAADEYAALTEQQKAASKRLADLMRRAYARDEQQAAIVRAAHHVWTREYLRIILGLNKKRPGRE